ncbi:MAG: hypothetical protein E6J45_12785, partial [Chloroflexi bacterium]
MGPGRQPDGVLPDRRPADHLRDRQPGSRRLPHHRADHRAPDRRPARPAPGGVSVSPTDLAVAFAAGFVSFVSPCVWPLIPGYLSFVSGVPGAELPAHRRRVILAAAGFVAGFSLLFALAGAGTGVLGSQFLDHRRGLELVGG